VNGGFNDLDLSGRQTVLDHDGGVDWGTIPMEKPFSLSHDWPLLPENLHQLVQGFDVVGIHCGSPGHIVGVHCKPGEAYTRLKTASCEASPGTTHMCTLEICIWSLQIPDNADKCALDYSTFGFSK
jgi:hypothetical protein